MERTGIKWLKDRFAACVCQHSFFFERTRGLLQTWRRSINIFPIGARKLWQKHFVTHCVLRILLWPWKSKKINKSNGHQWQKAQTAATTKRQNAAGLAKSFQRPSPTNSKMAQRLRATFFTEAADLHAQKKTNGSSIYKPSRFWHWKTMRRGRHRHIPTGKRLTKHCYVLCFTHTAAQNAETRVFRALNRIFSIFSGAWSTSNISWSSKLGGDQNHPKML